MSSVYHYKCSSKSSQKINKNNNLFTLMSFKTRMTFFFSFSFSKWKLSTALFQIIMAILSSKKDKKHHNCSPYEFCVRNWLKSKSLFTDNRLLWWEGAMKTPRRARRQDLWACDYTCQTAVISTTCITPESPVMQNAFEHLLKQKWKNSLFRNHACNISYLSTLTLKASWNAFSDLHIMFLEVSLWS